MREILAKEREPPKVTQEDFDEIEENELEAMRIKRKTPKQRLRSETSAARQHRIDESRNKAKQRRMFDD